MGIGIEDRDREYGHGNVFAENKNETPPWRRSAHKHFFLFGFRLWQSGLVESTCAFHTLLGCRWPSVVREKPKTYTRRGMGGGRGMELSFSDYRAGAATNLHNYELNSKLKCRGRNKAQHSGRRFAAKLLRKFPQFTLSKNNLAQV